MTFYSTVCMGLKNVKGTSPHTEMMWPLMFVIKLVSCSVTSCAYMVMKKFHEQTFFWQLANEDM